LGAIVKHLWNMILLRMTRRSPRRKAQSQWRMANRDGKVQGSEQAVQLLRADMDSNLVHIKVLMQKNCFQ
jgi:hypothetical protein